MMMETRLASKRRLKSSPQKKSPRVGLNFGQEQMLPAFKKRRVDASTSNSSSPESETEEESFSVNSFYGKREKKSFPHSPRRRKAVERVLSKIRDENIETDSEVSSQKSGYTQPQSIGSADFAFKSDTDEEPGRKVFEKAKNLRSSSRVKNRLQLQEVSNTLGNKTSENKNILTTVSRRSKSLENRYPVSVMPLPLKRSLASPVLSERSSSLTPKVARPILPETPDSSGKKFFKHRSPGDSAKLLGSIVVRKGFDLKFLPKRQLSDKAIKETTDKRKNLDKNNKSKNNSIKRLPAAKNLGTSELFCHNEKVKEESCQKKELNLEQYKGNNSSYVEDSGCCVSDLVEEVIDSEVSNSGRLETGEIKVLLESPDLSESASPARSSQDSADSVKSGPTFQSDSSTPQQEKLFPIFTKKPSPGEVRTGSSLKTRRSPSTSPRILSTLKVIKDRDNKQQMIIDAGQKKFGATQCDVCGMVYTHADPMDEATHAKFHQSLLAALKFPGWKKERVVVEYPDTGARVIMVTADDKKYAIKKVEEINKVMGEELGFPEPSLSFRPSYKAFLYVSEEKRIEGCCVAEPVFEGYRVISDSQGSDSQPGQRPWCCSDEPESAAVGISRIWVYSKQRQKGIATRLLDCVRLWFEYGIEIKKELMAFSDPTPDGRQLATRYTGTPAFLVYKYHHG
ncbi:hypothetical protein ACJMK2_041132 [Sinanodonta woodiana]|uniref:N-acetyltransferase ESCO2 n=1 Tax=Sinanodonta woodiana TaxID=1069815 RepID=A0ABD3W348_SINWO